MPATISTLSTAPTTTAIRPKRHKIAPAEATTAAPTAGGRRRKAKGVEPAVAASTTTSRQTEPETDAAAKMGAAAVITSPAAEADLPATTKRRTAKRPPAKRPGTATSAGVSPADPAADGATAPDALPPAISAPPPTALAQSRQRRPQTDRVIDQDVASQNAASGLAEPVSRSAAHRPTKSATLVALLQRAEGADLAELMAATGWLAHSVRAALSGLRKQNRELSRHKDVSGASRYHLPRLA